MNRAAVLCAAAFVVATVANLVPALADPNVGAANTAMIAVFKKSKAPGAGFAAGYKGKVVDAKGFGLANVAAKKPVDADTMFALASCSKPITAMAIMQLIEKKKFRLDTPAFAYLGISKGTDPRLGKITIEDLLNHSSGLPRAVNASTDDPMNTARAAAKVKLLFAPGTQQSYSNAGFDTLGAVVEKASGRNYVDYIVANVFGPAGVTQYGELESRAVIPGQAEMYTKSGKVAVNKRTEGGTPAGGWIMSPSSMVRILMAYAAGKIVSAASRAAMLAPPVAPLKPRSDGSAFGLGWDVVLRTEGADGVLYGKNGGITGTSTWIEHTPSGAVFAAFYNGGNGSGAHRPGLAAVERALGGG
jgi:N-acyl-D-amino-acid deacylase